MTNMIMSQHELERIYVTNQEFPLEPKCDQHSKLIDFICVTCDILLCSICAIENHKQHDVQHLKRYVRIKNIFPFKIMYFKLSYYFKLMVISYLFIYLFLSCQHYFG